MTSVNDEVKGFIRSTHETKWMSEHLGDHIDDAYYQLHERQ